MILAIDFDGTIVEDQFPEVGKMIPGASEAINQLYADGYTIIIWSCRTGIKKTRAIEWLVMNGIKFHRFNESCPTNIALHGGKDTRKVYANIYIDDAALGCPLIYNKNFHSRPYVDWVRVDKMLEEMGVY